MKKKLIIITSIILIILICILVFAEITGWLYKPSKQQIRYMTEINAANSIVWYYGNPQPGDEITINCKRVTEFTEETIGDKEEQYTYHAIVIFDFDGTMDISNEELLLIKNYCETRYYDMLYYGTAHLEQFRKCKFFTVFDFSECGFTYNGSYWVNRSGKEEYLNPYLLTGNWTVDDNNRYDTDDEHKIWKFVIQFIVSLINDYQAIL